MTARAPCHAGRPQPVDHIVGGPPRRRRRARGPSGWTTCRGSAHGDRWVVRQHRQHGLGQLGRHEHPQTQHRASGAASHRFCPTAAASQRIGGTTASIRCGPSSASAGRVPGPAPPPSGPAPQARPMLVARPANGHRVRTGRAAAAPSARPGARPAAARSADHIRGVVVDDRRHVEALRGPASTARTGCTSRCRPPAPEHRTVGARRSPHPSAAAGRSRSRRRSASARRGGGAPARGRQPQAGRDRLVDDDRALRQQRGHRGNSPPRR